MFFAEHSLYLCWFIFIHGTLLHVFIHPRVQLSVCPSFQSVNQFFAKPPMNPSDCKSVTDMFCLHHILNLTTIELSYFYTLYDNFKLSGMF